MTRELPSNRYYHPNLNAVEVRAIKHIHYSWGELRLFSDTRFDEIRELAPKTAFSMDIEPEDVEANDTVTVIWDIE